MCRTHPRRRLSLFGSATSGRFDPSRSDVDVLVEFEKMVPTEHAGHYFGLQEDLEALLQRPVDLVEAVRSGTPASRESIDARKAFSIEAA